jgi:hypothetical protein
VEGARGRPCYSPEFPGGFPERRSGSTGSALRASYPIEHQAPREGGKAGPPFAERRLPKCVSSLFCRNAAVADIVDPPLLTHSGLTVRPRSNVLPTLDFWNAAPAHQLQPDVRMGSNSPIVAAAPDRLAIGRLAMPERPVPGPLIAAVRCHIRSLHSLAELPEPNWPCRTRTAVRQRHVPACFRWTIGALFGRSKREKPADSAEFSAHGRPSLRRIFAHALSRIFLRHRREAA